MYIYIITNLINDKKYVGQTRNKNPLKRWSKHKSDANRNSNCTIHAAMRKYDIPNFKFEVIDESASNLDELNDLEEFYISFYDTYKGDGYNMTSGGDTMMHSEETIEKIRQARLGSKVTKETLKKMSESRMGDLNPMYGKTHTDETKEILRQVNLGKTHTDETRQVMSESRMGDLNPMYGKTHTDETKIKCSSVNIGNKYCVGRKYSKETIEKMSKAKKGKTGIQSKCSKVVVQIDKNNGKEITCWFSGAEVQREIGISSASISSCCNGKLKSAGGYIWKFL